MKKKFLAVMMIVTLIFPMVAYAQGSKGLVTRSQYDAETKEVEVAKECMADTINDEVLTWMEEGKEFEVSPLVEGKDYGYTRLCAIGQAGEMVVGYAKNKENQYVVVQLVSDHKLQDEQIISHLVKE